MSSIMDQTTQSLKSPRPFMKSKTEATLDLALKSLYVGQDPHIESICCLKCGEIPYQPRECNSCGSLICQKCTVIRHNPITPQLSGVSPTNMGNLSSRNKNKGGLTIHNDRCMKAGCTGLPGPIGKIHTVLQNILDKLLFKCPNESC